MYTIKIIQEIILKHVDELRDFEVADEQVEADMIDELQDGDDVIVIIVFIELDDDELDELDVTDVKIDEDDDNEYVECDDDELDDNVIHLNDELVE